VKPPWNTGFAFHLFKEECLTMSFIDSIFTCKKTMTARYWINASVDVEGRRPPFRKNIPTQIAIKLPERSGTSLPSRRDREVPYGMKGGEFDGR
jgi:hypothetical protein